MSKNNQLVHQIYAAFAAGDVPKFLGYLDPKIRWNEAESFPLADRNPYIGPEAIVRGVLERLFAEWDDFKVEVGEIVGDDVVTMFGRYQAKHKATGKALDVQAAHTWWFAGGKAVRFQQMVDTAKVLAVTTK
jgi:ketosteroid isomerase-like protein